MSAHNWIPAALLESSLRRSLAAGETLFMREDRLASFTSRAARSASCVGFS